jgi:hypothetical protein
MATIPLCRPWPTNSVSQVVECLRAESWSGRREESPISSAHYPLVSGRGTLEKKNTIRRIPPWNPRRLPQSLDRIDQSGHERRSCGVAPIPIDHGVQAPHRDRRVGLVRGSGGRRFSRWPPPWWASAAARDRGSHPLLRRQTPTSQSLRHANEPRGSPVALSKSEVKPQSEPVATDFLCACSIVWDFRVWSPGCRSSANHVWCTWLSPCCIYYYRVLVIDTSNFRIVFTPCSRIVLKDHVLLGPWLVPGGWKRWP